MYANDKKANITNILCPTDLSDRSQKTLGHATRIAEIVGARLTACHCMPVNWFTAHGLPTEAIDQAKIAMSEQIVKCMSADSRLTWNASVIQNSFDPAREIADLASESGVDLIVMKARPSVLSALRFGSIVERVVSRSSCPVLLIPSRCLADRDPVTDGFDFRRILFDYDFSEATDRLFHFANRLADDLHAELHVLSVLENPEVSAIELAASSPSRSTLQTAVRRKIKDVLRGEGQLDDDVPTAVEWGRHAETVLEYVSDRQIDLVCTTLPRPQFYFETFYSIYLGKLLRSAPCPILVAQSV